MTASLLILNGKKAGEPAIRDAVNKLRNDGHSLDVRVTWEGGDVQRFVDEASDRGLNRIIVGGGDGSLNEAANAMVHRSDPEISLGILPLGTANDFATTCAIPQTPLAALELALQGSARSIDVGCANDHHFLNVASIGFGASVTANTPVELKNFLGGGAYTIAGLVQALNFVPYPTLVRTPDREFKGELLVGAVCNGRTAGGGQPLAPFAMLDDGMLDVLALRYFMPRNAAQVVQELRNPEQAGEFVERFQASTISGESDIETPFNLDGEPFLEKQLSISVLPGAIRVILPPDCPCVASSGDAANRNDG